MPDSRVDSRVLSAAAVLRDAVADDQTERQINDSTPHVIAGRALVSLLVSKGVVTADEVQAAFADESERAVSTLTARFQSIIPDRVANWGKPRNPNPQGGGGVVVGGR